MSPPGPSLSRRRFLGLGLTAAALPAAASPGLASPVAPAAPAVRPRLRDLGVVIGELPTGAANAITDVPGVRVGHVTLVQGQGPLVVGRGPERDALAAAAGPNVEIAGELDDRAVASVLAEARGFVIAAVEDFGIAPVEAQAAGTPVVALGRGGALETVADGETGTFFREQSPGAIAEAVERLLRMEDRIDPARLRAQAERFGRPRFERAYRAFVEARLEERGSARSAARSGPPP